MDRLLSPPATEDGFRAKQKDGSSRAAAALPTQAPTSCCLPFTSASPSRILLTCWPEDQSRRLKLSKVVFVKPARWLAGRKHAMAKRLPDSPALQLRQITGQTPLFMQPTEKSKCGWVP